MKSFEELVVSPRIITDTPYDNAYNLVKHSLLLATVVFAILSLFGITPTIGALICFLAYLSTTLFEKIIVNKIYNYQTQKTIRQSQVSTMAVVKHTEYYGIVIFSKNKMLQASTNRMLRIAQKLRELDNMEKSDNPQIKHIQNRLWNVQNEFEAEELPAEIVGKKGIWWQHETMPNRLPDNFDIDRDILVGFVTNKKNKTEIKPFSKDFYENYLA